MKSKLTLAALSSCLFIFGCENISGTMNVLKDFRIQTAEEETVTEECQDNSGGGEGGAGSICFPDTIHHPAEYAEFKTGERLYATLKFQTKRKFTLDIDDRAEIKFKLSGNVTIPEYAGDFHLKSAEVGQDFDIAGSVRTDESDSETSSGWESCTISVPEEKCVIREVVIDGRTRHKSVCETIYRLIRGEQWSEYYFHNTDKHLAFRLLEPGTDSALAEFAGSTHDTSKRYIHQGPCRTDVVGRHN